MKSSVAIVVCGFLIVMLCRPGLAFQEENSPARKLQAASDPAAHPAIAELSEMKVELQKTKKALEESDEALKATQKTNERLGTCLKFLKIDRRIAHVTVLKKSKDEKGAFMEVRFSEVDDQNKAIGADRNFTIRGEKFYVDGWGVSFEDNYLKQADELRGTSFYVFKSIYGDLERPSKGQRLDVATEQSNVPGIYSDKTKLEFEQKVWSDFWGVIDDQTRQRNLGIRAVHGLAICLSPSKGQTYQVEIAANGRMKLTVLQAP